jgi:hypothetical protein
MILWPNILHATTELYFLISLLIKTTYINNNPYEIPDVGSEQQAN